MNDISLPTLQPDRHPRAHHARRFALVGAPNAGKTALFNALTGLRAKSSNFPGTTLEIRTAEFAVGGSAVELCDLPGLYSLSHGETEELLAASVLRGDHPGVPRPDAVIVVLDALNLPRHLALAAEVRQLNLPTLLVVTQMDLAREQGVAIARETLAQELQAPVVMVSARKGDGLEQLRMEIERLAGGGHHPDAFSEELACRIACAGCTTCPTAQRHAWAGEVGARALTQPALDPKWSDRLDRAFTHPVAGVAIFALIMTGFFAALFWLASFPMDWIEAAFGWLQGFASARLGDNLLGSLVADGVVAGVGGVLVFVPQIALLFFLLTLLEDTGYLARAAFVMDRVMNKVGLPGRAFVPLVSAHACAIPAIMATRILPNRRDRLVTILVLPLLTCSARLPVYAMIAAMLFSGKPWLGGLVFAGCYALGIVAALAAAFVFRHTLLKGEPRELLIELPAYKMPSLRTAGLMTWDRVRVFLKQAGTVILGLSIVLWAAGTFPRTNEAEQRTALTKVELWHLDLARANMTLASEHPPSDEEVARMKEGIAPLEAKMAAYAQERTVLGRAGHFVEPVFRPLGFDWRISVGVLSSFAAREVMVSTLNIITGVGEDADEDSAIGTLQGLRRPDGSVLFDPATCVSLLVFFVLAMQCLPTQAITRRETGSWKWAVLQFAYMTALAWGAAFVAYRLVLWL